MKKVLLVILSILLIFSIGCKQGCNGDENQNPNSGVGTPPPAVDENEIRLDNLNIIYVTILKSKLLLTEVATAMSKCSYDLEKGYPDGEMMKIINSKKSQINEIMENDDLIKSCITKIGNIVNDKVFISTINIYNRFCAMCLDFAYYTPSYASSQIIVFNHELDYMSNKLAERFELEENVDVPKYQIENPEEEIELNICEGKVLIDGLYYSINAIINQTPFDYNLVTQVLKDNEKQINKMLEIKNIAEECIKLIKDENTKNYASDMFNAYVGYYDAVMKISEDVVDYEIGVSSYKNALDNAIGIYQYNVK